MGIGRSYSVELSPEWKAREKGIGFGSSCSVVLSPEWEAREMGIGSAELEIPKKGTEKKNGKGIEASHHP